MGALSSASSFECVCVRLGAIPFVLLFLVCVVAGVWMLSRVIRRFSHHTPGGAFGAGAEGGDGDDGEEAWCADAAKASAGST